jgi:hypothetical protein
MAYVNKTTPRTTGLIARPEHSDLSGIFDDIVNGVKSAGQSAINFYNSAQQAKGAAGAYSAMTPPPAPAAGGGISTQTLLLLGAAGLGLYFITKK